jgi:hypothetical protein
MTAATAPPPDVTAYLAAVRDALSDLPDAERDDLLAEVEDSLLEAAGEGGSISARLGPPAEFAAELRVAAGLHETTATQARTTPSIRELAARLANHPGVAALRRLGHELAPIWWVLRAYLAVGAIAYIFDTGWSTRYPVVPRFDSAKFGLALVILAMIASVWLGLRTRRAGWRYPRLVTALNAALVVAIVPVSLDLANTSAYDSLVAAAYAPPPAATPQLSYDGILVENVYPYSRSGRLLHDVLLYDALGRPLDIGGLGDPQRRLLETVDGKPMFNSFPIRYFEPNTMRVANPNAGPQIDVPEITTPALPRR